MQSTDREASMIFFGLLSITSTFVREVLSFAFTSCLISSISLMSLTAIITCLQSLLYYEREKEAAKK